MRNQEGYVSWITGSYSKMDNWKEDHFDKFFNLASEHEIYDAFLKMARDLGFEYCAYGLRVAIPTSCPKFHMLNNYSPIWNERYSEKNYLNVDPTINHGLSSNMPVVWSDELFRGAQEMWIDAQSVGLRYGWAQASRDTNGVSGLVTFARSTEILKSNELRANQLKLSWLSHVFHNAISEVVIQELIPESTTKLTRREVEVLKWSASGKTSSETGCILGISDCTVEYHLKNSMIKLNCTNKIGTTVKALTLGLIN
jgi:LuxR family transcriptional regulator